MALGRIRQKRRGTRQDGFFLLVVVFMVFLMTMALLAVAPREAQQIQRDREEEMIHRGVQYSRAIKRYFKKFGRYPTSVDQLEDTNHIRFLRQRYKDPMTEDGKWKELHFGDVKFATAPAVGQTPGQIAAQQQKDVKPLGGGKAGEAGEKKLSGATTAAQTFGGALIGVASLSEKEGLREFNEKTHYNEWYFVYDPSVDRGGMITGPYTGKVFAGATGGLGTAPGGAAGTGLGVPAGALGQPAGQQPGAITTPQPQKP
jgi:type II secretory pathway pseudopilin PulG